jgi:hypothetical protein
VTSPDGVPHPIDVVPAVAIPGGYGLDTTILVAGTNLLRRPFPGLWRIRASVDGTHALDAEAVLEMSMVQ